MGCLHPDFVDGAQGPRSSPERALQSRAWLLESGAEEWAGAGWTWTGGWAQGGDGPDVCWWATRGW